MRKNYWFRVCAWGTCSLAILGADAVGTRWSASAAEPPLEQYITLDDGLYALQADGTYSKVEGKRPQPHTHTHSHNQGAGGRPNASVPPRNEKYLRLDDGLYVLQSDGTYMRAQDMPRPVSPGNRPNSNNQQAWQDDGWDDEGNGWNQPQWQNDGRRPQPQPQWTDNRPVRPNRPQPQPQWTDNHPVRPNRPQPQPQWTDNRPVRPNRPSNNQDMSGQMVEGQNESADDGRSDLEKLGEFLDAIIQ